jgi:hypothetical protein
MYCTYLRRNTLAARGLEEHVRITLIFSRIISFMSFTVLPRTTGYLFNFPAFSARGAKLVTYQVPNRNKNGTKDIDIQAFDAILQLGVGYRLIA